MRIVVAHGADETVAPPRRHGRVTPPTDVQQVAAILRKAGHEVTGLAVDGTPDCLRALAQLRADLVFNMVESFGEARTQEPHVAAYYDLLGLRYTGSGPRGLSLAMDKALTKKVLSFHEVTTPRFAVVWRGRLDWAHEIEFPVIVKPVREDGSIGIGFDALAGTVKELMERIDQLHGEFDAPVLIEQYVEGRELYVSVLGNARPQPMPPVELDLSHLPKGVPRIAGSEVKWDEGTRAYRGSKVRIPRLRDEVVERMHAHAVTAFQTLGLRDYARVDFRLTRDGTPYLIEVNPNPYLHSNAEFIRGCRAAGRTQTRVVLDIVDSALARYAARGPER